jgi:hypothetical protein
MLVVAKHADLKHHVEVVEEISRCQASCPKGSGWQQNGVLLLKFVLPLESIELRDLVGRS